MNIARDHAKRLRKAEHVKHGGSSLIPRPILKNVVLNTHNLNDPPLNYAFLNGFKRKILAAGSSLTRADIKSHQLIGLPFLREPFFANEKRNEGHRFTPLRSGFSSRNYINSIPAARS